MKILLSTILLLVSSVSAQFQFFDQFFQGGNQQQQQQAQQKQNAPSDSNWYRGMWEGGMCFRRSRMQMDDFFALDLGEADGVMAFYATLMTSL